MAARRRVVAFGVFDLLHPGHLSFLEKARRLGDELVVVVSRDARVLAEKGSLPILGEEERLSMIKALQVVDRAVLGDPPGRWSVLKRLRPTIVAVGYDQRCSKDAGTPWRLVRISARLKVCHRSSRLRKALAHR